jgi:acyl-coenzyme A synthetase/AMP-(fatty) acid ligase
MRDDGAIEGLGRFDEMMNAAGVCGSPLEVEAALDAFAKDRLARYKCGRLWVQIPEIPRTRTGECERRALRALIEARNGET